MVVQHDY
jgi:hypothetical protein